MVRRRTGFTLIEVMVTVVIIAILAAVASFGFWFAQRKDRVMAEHLEIVEDFIHHETPAAPARRELAEV